MRLRLNVFKLWPSRFAVILLVSSGIFAQTSCQGRQSKQSKLPSERLEKAGASAPQHTVSLSWKASTTPGVTYNVYRRGLQGDPAKINSDPICTTSYVDSSVQPGQTYFYVIKAANEKGRESAPSNEIRAVIPAP